MTNNCESFDLYTEGSKALLNRTLQQFSVWDNLIRRTLKDHDTVNIDHSLQWYRIMSAIVFNGDNNGLYEKKTLQNNIDGLAFETARKYVSELENVGLIQTIRRKRTLYSALTPEGEYILERTLATWVSEFGKIHEMYFMRDRDGVQKPDL